MTHITAYNEAELRALAAQAAPGTWEWDGEDLVGDHDPVDLEMYPDEDRRESILHRNHLSMGLREPQDEDAAFIAAANPVTVVALLDRISELEGEVSELEGEVEEVIHQRDQNEEWANALAYAIAPVVVIGEHSSSNNPWYNALHGEAWEQ